MYPLFFDELDVVSLSVFADLAALKIFPPAGRLSGLTAAVTGGLNEVPIVPKVIVGFDSSFCAASPF
jgi:hypothetical protein